MSDFSTISYIYVSWPNFYLLELRSFSLGNKVLLQVGSYSPSFKSYIADRRSNHVKKGKRKEICFSTGECWPEVFLKGGFFVKQFGKTIVYMIGQAFVFILVPLVVDARHSSFSRICSLCALMEWFSTSICCSVSR